nr:zinc finger protein 33B-like isoform X3 [Nerophis lumbriciformis]
MLKELVKERLMTSADEIFALFESTIATYEEELSRTKEENERHRQQLQAVCKTLQIKDVQQLISPQEEHTLQLWGHLEPGPLPSHIKEEEKDIWVNQEGECLRWLKEADLTKLPLTGVSVKTEDHEQESQADNFLAPLSKCKDTASRFPDNTRKLFSDTDREGDLRTHTDNKHSDCSNKKTDKKHWTCTVCDKSFSNKGHLNRHMMTHTGEKPFCCPVCNKKFSQRSPMASHMKTHSGKQYPCSVCSRSYYYEASLKAHTRTHHGELK